MDFFFLVYILLILIIFIYLIYFKYYNQNTKDILLKNTKPIISTKMSLLDTTNKSAKDCNKQTVFCQHDSDCMQLCSINEAILIQYKCNEINICTQSVLENETTNNTPIDCNRKNNFIPTLTADEFFQPHWICLNTRPQLFDDKTQDFHTYICAGGNRTALNQDDIFNSCVCDENKIKVYDEFRNNIPLCIEKKQISLFPNFTFASSSITI